MNKKVIYLISGWAGSGKDTVADYIINKHSNFQKLSFATPLKIFVSEKYNFPLELTLTQEGKNTKIIDKYSVRELLIKEAKNKRKRTPDFFAKKLVKNIIPEKNIVIADWRFVNEYNYLKNLDNYDIKTIRIQRTRVPSIISDTENRLNEFEFDLLIFNTFKTLQSLYDFIDYLKL